MRIFILFFCLFWLGQTVGQPVVSVSVSDTYRARIEDFFSPSQLSFNKMFIKYCDDIIRQTKGARFYDSNYSSLSFDFKNINWANPKIEETFTYFNNFMADKKQNTEHRIMALEYLHTYFDESTAIGRKLKRHSPIIDTIGATELVLKILDRKAWRTKWIPYFSTVYKKGNSNYAPFTTMKVFFIDIAKDRAIPTLWKLLNYKKRTPFYCWRETRECSRWKEAHRTRYCDYAMEMLAKICKYPAFQFHEDNQKDDEEIAKLKLYVKAYCAERGIKLE